MPTIRLAGRSPEAVSGSSRAAAIVRAARLILGALLGLRAPPLLGVGFVLSPIDLLPSILLGPLGLVDDLIVVTATLSRLLNHIHPDVVRAHWSGKGDALEVIQRVTLWSEGLFSGRLRALVRGRVVPGRR